MKKTLLSTLSSTSSWRKIEQPLHRILIDNKRVNSWEINVSLISMDAELTRACHEVSMYLTEYHKVTDGL